MTSDLVNTQWLYWVDTASERAQWQDILSLGFFLSNCYTTSPNFRTRSKLLETPRSWTREMLFVEDTEEISWLLPSTITFLAKFWSSLQHQSPYIRWFFAKIPGVYLRYTQGLPGMTQFSLFGEFVNTSGKFANPQDISGIIFPQGFQQTSCDPCDQTPKVFRPRGVFRQKIGSWRVQIFPYL